MTTEKLTGRGSDKIMLRVPDGMRDKIAEEAKRNNRTMNAEIVSRLTESFEQRPKGGMPDSSDQMAVVTQQIRENEVRMHAASSHEYILKMRIEGLQDRLSVLSHARENQEVREKMTTELHEAEIEARRITETKVRLRREFHDLDEKFQDLARAERAQRNEKISPLARKELRDAMDAEAAEYGAPLERIELTHIHVPIVKRVRTKAESDAADELFRQLAGVPGKQPSKAAPATTKDEVKEPAKPLPASAQKRLFKSPKPQK